MATNEDLTPSIKKSNISSKMLIAQMIRNRQSMTYSNSKYYNITLNLTRGIEADIKKILLSFGTSFFERNVNKIINSASYSDEMKDRLRLTIQNIFNNLTEEEEKTLGIYIPDTTENEITLENERQQQLSNPDYVFYCRMIRENSSYVSITNIRRDFFLTPGKKYLFDLQHPTNTGFQLSLAHTRFIFEDADGVYITGTPGSLGAFLVYSVPREINSFRVFLYNKLDSGINSFNRFPYLHKLLIIELDYNDKSKKVFSDIEQNIFVRCLTKVSKLGIVNANGPKYVINDINFTYADNPGISIINRYNQNKRYGMYYGSYIINLESSRSPFTILNKGKEHLIQIFGDESKKTTKYLNYLDDDGYNDGSYNLFYGNVRIEVYGDFGIVPLYSLDYGFFYTDKMFVFSDECYENGVANTNYVERVSNDIVCMHPQTIFNTVIEGENEYIVFNNHQTYVPSRRYGMHDGQYMIFNIPENNPIAFINNEKESYFTYTGAEANKRKRLGPDNILYDFYYGTIIIYVYGDFGSLSVYDFYNGYSGGKFLLHYTDFCDFESPWVPDSALVPEIPSTFESIQENNYTEHDDTNSKQFLNYMKFGIKIVNGEEKVIFYDPTKNINDITYENNQIYLLNTGIYVIMDIPENRSIAFLNKGLESVFQYDGYFPHKSESIDPAGINYDFYYGNVNIFVNLNSIQSDFGRMSIYVKDHGFLNGKRLLKFSGNSQSGQAIPRNSIISAYPLTLNTIDNNVPQEFYIDIGVKKFSLPYSNNYNVFIFYGYDRNGLINSNEENPILTFLLGDKVYFNFLYNDTSHYLNIYERVELLTDPQLIQNNTPDSNFLQIKWTPNFPGSSYYYYRSSFQPSVIFGTINVIPNNNIELLLNLIEFTPSNNSTITVLLNKIVFKFNEIVNVDLNAKVILYNRNTRNNEYVYGVNDMIGTGTKEIKILTKFNLFNRLHFDTTYDLIVFPTSFRNIYVNFYETLSINNVLSTFTTEPIHAPAILNIDPVSYNPNNEFIDTSLTNNIRCLQFDTSLNINDDFNVVFGDISYETNVKYGMYDGNYNFTNISENNAITILNQDVSNSFIISGLSTIDKGITDSSNIWIRSVGNEPPYYTFHSSSSSTTPLTMKLLRGLSYTFRTTEDLADLGFPFKLAVPQETLTLSFPTDLFTYTIPNDISFIIYESFSNSNNDICGYIPVSTIPGDYDNHTYYYDTINIDVSADFTFNNSGLSIVSYNYGLQGGSNKLVYSDQCEPQVDSTQLSVDLEGSISVTFDEPIQYLFSSFGAPKFYEYLSIIPKGTLSVTTQTNVLTMTYNSSTAELEYNKTYRIAFEPGSIKDLSYVDFPLIGSSLDNYLIRVQEDPRPQIIQSFPKLPQYNPTLNTSDPDIVESLDFSFTIQFNKVVNPGTSGYINIISTDDTLSLSTIIDFYNFSNPDDISDISGWGTNTISFNPAGSLASNTFFAVLIDPTTIVDNEGNHFAGFLNISDYFFKTFSTG